MFCCNSVILANEVCCPNERIFPADAMWDISKDVYRTPGQSLHLIAKMGRGGEMSIAIKNSELLHSLDAIEGCASKLGKYFI